MLNGHAFMKLCPIYKQFKNSVYHTNVYSLVPQSKLDNLQILDVLFASIRCIYINCKGRSYSMLSNSQQTEQKLDKLLEGQPPCCVAPILCDRDTSQGQTEHMLYRKLFPLLQQLGPQCGHHWEILSQLTHGEPLHQIPEW